MPVGHAITEICFAIAALIYRFGEHLSEVTKEDGNINHDIPLHQHKTWNGESLYSLMKLMRNECDSSYTS